MKEKLQRINEYLWLVPKAVRKGMRVNAVILANEADMAMIEEEAINQLTNVAMLPGVVEPVMAMPDAHWGYGLPMGAVGVFDPEQGGIISSGMTGFDINCGINLIRTNLGAAMVKQKLRELVDEAFKAIPCGVGARSKLKLSIDELKEVLKQGMKWALSRGYGCAEDLEHTEEHGAMDGADPSRVSELALKRGRDQLGTLGSGNHFLEFQEVVEIFDKDTAKEWGLEKGKVCVMVHCGSRGLGHQIATDYLKIHEKAATRYNIQLPDKQLACAPINSPEGQDYFKAMKCAVNYSFTNRLIITHWIREVFERVFGKKWRELGMYTVYGLAHNICKKETHTIKGEKREVYVHRKGATRSFPGLPVLIAGSMGTSSWVMKGTEEAMQLTFGSTAHGAGRVLSRKAAIKKYWGGRVKQEMESAGRIVRAANMKVLAEEAPGAYKDVDAIIETVHQARVSLKVAKLVPLGVIKG
ncbi:RNA-splicing ligase RtcB [Candidatus Woesearchaeota archaeon]|nr:MAG: RNA-splicing ligase RtcB [Candidatus Woesearchaeota archaeon]